MSRLQELHPKRFFLDTWKQVDREAAEERANQEGYDFRPLVVFCAGGVFLTLMEYFGSSPTMYKWLELFVPRESSLPGQNLLGNPAAQSPIWDVLLRSEFSRLYAYVWWAGWRVLGYFLLPLLTLWTLKQKPKDYGLDTKGFASHAWIYLLCYAVVLVCVVIVSFTDSFSSYYPFYKLSSRSWFDFISWEILYAAQFFSLEFFFRGYWLQACKRMMGSHAIFAMVVPYCMIHFGKPWIEAIAAILAGVVLGTLAMKTRSIWSGFLIHVSVAVSMDVASLLQGNGLPEKMFP